MKVEPSARVSILSIKPRSAFVAYLKHRDTLRIHCPLTVMQRFCWGAGT